MNFFKKNFHKANFWGVYPRTMNAKRTGTPIMGRMTKLLLECTRRSPPLHVFVYTEHYREIMSYDFTYLKI